MNIKQRKISNCSKGKIEPQQIYYLTDVVECRGYDKQWMNICFFLGLGRLSQAEEYLAQAQWTVLKTPECPDSIRSKLFRNLGLLYAAQGNYPDALSQLADDVSSLNQISILT